MLVVIVTNLSAMMIDLVNQCKFLKVKMRFKDLLKKTTFRSWVLWRSYKKWFSETIHHDRRKWIKLQMAAKFHIPDKLYDAKVIKVRDCCQITGKYGGSKL